MYNRIFDIIFFYFRYNFSIITLFHEIDKFYNENVVKIWMFKYEMFYEHN